MHIPGRIQATHNFGRALKDNKKLPAVSETSKCPNISFKQITVLCRLFVVLSEANHKTKSLGSPRTQKRIFQ